MSAVLRRRFRARHIAMPRARPPPSTPVAETRRSDAQGSDLWLGPTFAEYEAGKKRRYELTFAVNGGGFALAQFLIGDGRSAPGGVDWATETFGLSPIQFGVAMVAFNLAMFADTYAFGDRAAFFGAIGKLVLAITSIALTSAWLLASGLGDAGAAFLLSDQAGRSGPVVAVGLAVSAVGLLWFAVSRLPFEAVDLTQTQKRVSRGRRRRGHR